MATVREGDRAVLVVVDVQVGVMKDAWEAQRVIRNMPAEGEASIHKMYNSSFEQTSLDLELARLGATHIVLAGAATNWCIRATADAALDRGYDLTLLKDAHTTEPMQLDGGVTIEAETLVQELNIAMQWLEYPGRRNGAASASDIRFTEPGGIG